MIDGYALGTDNQSDELTVNSAAITAKPTGNPAQTQLYQIGVANGEQLVAVVHSEGVTTRLLLEDAQGNILTQSDGQSDADGDDLINIQVWAGTYFVAVQCLSGSGTYTLTLTTMPASAPFQTISVGSNGASPLKTSLQEFESRFGPVLLMLPGRPTVVVPIQRTYADRLLDTAYQHSLFPRPEASVLGEKLYLSSPWTLSVLVPGAVTLFYESMGADNGRGAIVAAAQITRTAVSESADLTIERLDVEC